MGRYYNKGRGNLPLTLSNGHSTSVPGNKWIELHGADETTASVMRAVRKGQLFRAKDPKKDPKPVEVKTEAPASDETPQDSAPVEPKPQLAAKKKATKKKVVSKKARAKRARSSR
jgi:hypothetical protein